MSDAFELASEIFNVIAEEVTFSAFEEKKRHSFIHKTNIVLKGLYKGAVFALPMAISVFAMLALRFPYGPMNI